MEYRILPHGKEKISTLGLGMSGIQNSSPKEIEKVIQKAIKNGITFFDLCAGGKSVYEPFGRAMLGRREQVYLQVHFGAVYKGNGLCPMEEAVRNCSSKEDAILAIKNRFNTL